MAEANQLISFVASMSGEGNLRVEENLGEGFVRLRVSEAERRQAKHDIQHVEDIVIELLRNARDAGASQIFLATQKTGDVRQLLIFDNGSGVPQDMQERIFDARVTSKLESMKMDRWGVHGRGMALFSIRQNVDDIHIVSSSAEMGTVFSVTIDTSVLNERADQSTWPVAEKDENGKFVCSKGPHNINRTVCEFALEDRRSCDVYLGSPSEIAATLFDRAKESVDTSQILFIDSADSLPVCDRLAFASDASDFIEIAQSIGIQISERTAHRILCGQISPLPSVSSKLFKERKRSVNHRSVDLTKDRRGLHISQEDLSSFSRSIERSFADIAERYYVNLSSDPKIKIASNKITITLDLDKEE